ncbi:hypothetical protein EI969_10695 [Pseudomonas sp. PB101]|nr:hypothetical protein [Pseudomonas sp. PB101]
MIGPLREQARSHIGSALYTKPVITEDLLWERACSRWGQRRLHQWRRLPRSHRYSRTAPRSPANSIRVPFFSR